MFLNFSSTSQILVDTSRYTVNSLLLTLQDSQFLQFNLDEKNVGPSLGPKYLNTSYMDSILPGLVERYGRDQPMSINLVTKEAPVSFFEVGVLGVRLTADLQVYVGSELAAVIEVTEGEGSLYAALGPYTDYLLVIRLLTFKINGSKVVSSQIGNIDVESMRNFVNFYAWLALPVVNVLMQPGF